MYLTILEENWPYSYPLDEFLEDKGLKELLNSRQEVLMEKIKNLKEGEELIEEKGSYDLYFLVNRWAEGYVSGTRVKVTRNAAPTYDKYAELFLKNYETIS